jgi:G:T/U-mismatch repair DNA glycosylase
MFGTESDSSRMNRYYFTIPSANIWEVVHAHSFVDAKHQAFKNYSAVWNEVEWVHMPFDRKYAEQSASQNTVSQDTTTSDNITASFS